MTRPRPRYDLGLDRGQLALLLVACAIAAAAMGGSWARGRTELGSEPPVDPDRVAAATERIDPNTASAASLRRLGGVGPVTAEAIIEYRRVHGPGAFRTPDDLQGVRGIGPVTVARLAPHLDLPGP